MNRSLPSSSVHNEFSTWEYWSGLLFPLSGDLLYPRIEPCPLALQEVYHLSYQGSLYMCVYIYMYEWVSEVAQSCPTLCNPMDCSLPDSSVHGILQSIVLEWTVISYTYICICVYTHIYMYMYVNSVEYIAASLYLGRATIVNFSRDDKI